MIPRVTHTHTHANSGFSQMFEVPHTIANPVAALEDGAATMLGWFLHEPLQDTPRAWPEQRKEPQKLPSRRQVQWRTSLHMQSISSFFRTGECMQYAAMLVQV